MAAIKKIFLSRITQGLLPLFFFFILTCFVTYPLIFRLEDTLPGIGDQLLVTWIMNWDIHALFHDPFNLFNANIFYPYKNTLAYSDIFLTSALFSLPALLIIKQPIVVYSWTLILSLTLLGYFTYLLTRYISKNYFAGIISGVLVAFSTFTLGKISVLQLISIQWVPLSLYFFLLFLKTSRAKYFIFFCVSFLLQIYNSFLPAYFILFSAVIIFLFHKGKKELFKSFLQKRIITTAIFTVLFIIPVAYPYYQVSREFTYVRDIRDTIAFANRIDFSFYPPDATIFEKDILSLLFSQNKNPLTYVGYLGLMFYILLLFSLFYFARSWWWVKERFILCFLTIAGMGYVLSLGPALQWGEHIIKKPFIIPLPYAIFYYLIPGFKGIRNSARWEMLFVLAGSIAIALVIAHFLRGQKRWYQVAFAFLVIAGVLLEVSRPLTYNTVERKEEFPKVYSYIATLPKNASMIELPLYSWYMTPYSMTEFKRVYYSTSNYSPMVNGYSGFSPIEWEKRSNEYLWNFPNDSIIKYFQEIDLDYIVLHKTEYDTLEQSRYTILNRRASTWNQVQSKLKKYTFITLQKQIGEDYVYKIEK